MKKRILTQTGLALAAGLFANLPARAEGNAAFQQAVEDLFKNAIAESAKKKTDLPPNSSETTAPDAGPTATPTPEQKTAAATPTPEPTADTARVEQVDTSDSETGAIAQVDTSDSETGNTAPAPVVSPDFTPVERVLSKPRVQLYTAADESKKSAQYLPSYSILRVLGRRDGWVQVRIAGKEGWLKESDVLPWKHQLVAQFAEPGTRGRTLFFKSKDAALAMANLEDDARKTALDDIYNALEKNTPLDNADIVATEPDGWAEMKNNFYLYPIINFEAFESETDDETEVQAIEIAAATENTENAADIKNTLGMTLDLVFVIDLSRSMEPIKDQVMDAVTKIAESVKSNPEYAESSIRFGLWGYRDDPAKCRGIEYVTKNYTEESLLPAAEFIEVLKNVKATEVDSIDYSEDVLAGVHDAVANTKWGEKSARVVLLIGDAPGREPGETDPFNRRPDKPVGTAANMGIKEIVGLAQQKQVEIGTVYINVAKYSQYLPYGEDQFTRLATNTKETPSVVIKVKDKAEVAAFSNDTITWLQDALRRAATQNQQTSASTEGQKFASSLFENAKVRWLAKNHQVGVTPEMSGWVLDKDIMDQGIDSVKPGVLVNRAQLEIMTSMLQYVIDAAEKIKSESSSEIFTALQSIVLASSNDPSLLQDARTMADSRFIPAFLQNLPYRSSIAKLSNEWWQSVSANEQDNMIREIRRKLEYYKELYNKTDDWMALDPNESEDQKVVFIPISELP